MNTYDLCLAWNWEYDADFVELMKMSCGSQGLSLLEVTPGNLDDALKSLSKNEISFYTLFDRASDSDPCFIPLSEWARDHAIYHINPYERASVAWSKAAMHQALMSAGLQTPYTIILPPYSEQPVLPPIDLSPLGEKFIIKPDHGGGGEGVVTEATSLSQVLSARKECPADKYLLQAHIIPALLDSRPAWFRVIYCTEEVYPFWWDTQSHIYTPLSLDEEKLHRLDPLRHIASMISRVCGLELFSTEIALTPESVFVVVDYVNDQIDLRLRSKTFDGVPDNVVFEIARRLIELVKAHCPPADQAKTI